MSKIKVVSLVKLVNRVYDFLMDLVCFNFLSCAQLPHLLINKHSYFQDKRVGIATPILQRHQVLHCLPSKSVVVHKEVEISQQGKCSEHDSLKQAIIKRWLRFMNVLAILLNLFVKSLQHLPALAE